MKKQLIALALILVLAALAAACGQNVETSGFAETTTEPATVSETTTALAEESSSQTADGESTEQAAETSPVNPVATTHTAVASTSAARSSTTTRPASALQATSATKSQTTTRTTTTTRAPTTTRAITTSTTKRTATTNGAFDINDYIAYGIEYGESIGYRHEPEVVESWDTPIAAYPVIPDDYIKDSIRSRLDFYKKTEPDVTLFHIWAEKQPDGTYDIYIARG